MRRVLVVAAHPDDEVLGCGGTIAALTGRGAEVTVLILGEGITSRYGARADAEKDQIVELQQDARAAGAHLGAREVLFEGLPDNRFDSVPLLDVVKIVERHVERLSPDTVFTQHGGDLNIDHRVVYRATLTATRPVAGCGVRALYAYEVASSTEWAFGSFDPVFSPNVFVDISSTIGAKLKAMEAYRSERRAFPHPRSAEALRAAAARWGAAVGVAAAEPFQLVRQVLA